MKACHSFPILVAIMLAAIAARAAPVTFNTALPVGGGEFVARGLFILSQSGNDPSGTDRDHRAVTSIAVLGYGLNHKLALFGVLPYVDRELDMTLMGSRVNRAASGLGDMSVFMRYTVVQRDR
ncbi:MAG: transporter, partial [Proteobacteria bacterium]|nr:transporter [Pseudomonadota bacterium]